MGWLAKPCQQKQVCRASPRVAPDRRCSASSCASVSCRHACAAPSAAPGPPSAAGWVPLRSSHSSADRSSGDVATQRTNDCARRCMSQAAGSAGYAVGPAQPLPAPNAAAAAAWLVARCAAGVRTVPPGRPSGVMGPAPPALLLLVLGSTVGWGVMQRCGFSARSPHLTTMAASAAPQLLQAGGMGAGDVGLPAAGALQTARPATASAGLAAASPLCTAAFSRAGVAPRADATAPSLPASLDWQLPSEHSAFTRQ